MIGFNRPYMTGEELTNISLAHNRFQLAGDGSFTKECQQWLQSYTKSKGVLLTHSCTAALEMAALLANIKSGDEIIMPSYTFVSTANAFTLRGAIPIFVDITSETLNIDSDLIEQAITCKTKAIVIVHYAGVAAEMDKILVLAKKYNLMVIEDAAQGIMAQYKGQALGTMGDMGTYSFHETKNIISGEGGCILLNREDLLSSAEIIREKGTNRSKFFRGEVDKYTWVETGSSYLPGEIISAFLLAQLNHAREITDKRLRIWNSYFDSFESLEKAGFVKRPTIPEYCVHNGHIFYLILNDLIIRDSFIEFMKQHGIQCVFHYIPLHTSPYYSKTYKRTPFLPITDKISESIVRFPIWLGIEEHLEFIIRTAFSFFEN